jgi:hypothetical protein
MQREFSSMVAMVGLVLAGTALSQGVYKSVDAQGRVTYSAKPPTDVRADRVERVPIAPGPTEHQRQAAEKRSKALRAATQKVEKVRGERDVKASRDAAVAKRELKKAEAALQEAKLKGDDDWQYLSTGGRVLKQDYLDRVKEAEQAVQQARRSVREAESTR